MMMLVGEDSTAMVEKVATHDEAMSTTEESNSSANGDISTSEDEQEEMRKDMDVELQKQEALRQYSERFGVVRSMSGLNHKVDQGQLAATHTQVDEVPCIEAGTKPVEEILAEVDLDMALEAEEEMVEDSVKGKTESEPELMLTFGYAGSLDEHPPFAKFDIRDAVCLKVGGFKHGEVVKDRSGGELVVVGVKAVEGAWRLWFHPTDLGRPGAGAFYGTSLESIKMRVSTTLAEPSAPHFHEMTADQFDAAEDFDGEKVVLCSHCALPVGETAYTYKKALVHGECMAQMMLNDYKKEEKDKKEKADSVKKMGRAQYDIGWRTEEIPQNVVPSELLGCQPAPEGMCCLAFDEEAHSVSVVPTLEPAQSLNLEYLSLALRVRLTEGREPLFSLDPVAERQVKNTMQVKRFEPEWLAGTCVGEVMFQADYHLKELSMGECMQPIVGMKNLLDYAEEEGRDKEWTAREWFVVRKAEILMTDDKVLVPRVKMAIEAREQVLEDDEVVDMKSTRPNHPMVKYADAFTHNFDLIAERKSVMFHLRELARASAMAKMLIDGEVNLDPAWFSMSGHVKEICSMEVPQLWNHRGVLKMRVQDGEVVDENDAGGLCITQGIYGGVNFGLQLSGVSMPSAVSQGRLAGLGVAAGITKSRLSGLMPAAGISSTRLSAVGLEPKAGISMPAVTSRDLSMPTVAAKPTVTAVGVSAPRAARPVAAVQLGAAAPAAAPQVSRSLPVTTRPTISAAPVLGSRPSAGLQAVAAPAVVVSAAAPLQASAAPAQVTTRALAAVPAPAVVSRGLAAPAPQMPARPTISVAVPGLSVTPPGLAAVRKPVTYGAGVQSTQTFLTRTAPAPVVPVDPQGVDLNLDQFNLAAPISMEGGGWGSETYDVKSVAMGYTFWASIDAEGSDFRSEDKKLLQAIYDSNLSDRRAEGDKFVPPDTSYDYVEKLRSLVKEEEECRQQRVQQFLSPEFSMAKPGPLFPKTWEPSVEISHGKVDADAAGKLHARPDYQKQSQKLLPILRQNAPTFDESTEEGMHFRIYRLGSLEVRTTQAAAEQEIIGAVFAPVEQANLGHQDLDLAQVVKVTEFVEAANDSYRSYVVLESQEGDFIMTEKLPDGTAAWQENPSDLERRNAFAKTVRSCDCSKHGITVSILKEFQAKDSCAGCSKYYAQRIYNHAIKADNVAYTGYRKPEQGHKWQLSERKYGLYASSASMPDDDKSGEAQQTECKNGKRAGVGDKVQIKASGRHGTITADDRSAVPYQVVFADGQRPKTKWVKEQDLEVIV